MRVYSLALFKKTKANKASESLFVCARRIIMAELPNNEKEGEEAKRQTREAKAKEKARAEKTVCSASFQSDWERRNAYS